MWGGGSTRPVRRTRQGCRQIVNPGIPGAVNWWCPGQGQARAAALRAATQLGPGHRIVHDSAPGRGLPHYHVVDPLGGRVSGHYFYGGSPPRQVLRRDVSRRRPQQEAEYEYEEHRANAEPAETPRVTRRSLDEALASIPEGIWYYFSSIVGELWPWLGWPGYGRLISAAYAYFVPQQYYSLPRARRRAYIESLVSRAANRLGLQRSRRPGWRPPSTNVRPPMFRPYRRYRQYPLYGGLQRRVPVRRTFGRARVGRLRESEAMFEAEVDGETGKGWRRVGPSTAVGRLPRLSGRTPSYVLRQIRSQGFQQSRTQPNVFVHPDGSEVRIDRAHNPDRGPQRGGYRGDIETHYHKVLKDPYGNEIKVDDRGYIVDEATERNRNRSHIISRRGSTYPPELL